MTTWCIYKHTNKVNGKVYIGQTCQKPEDRWESGNGYEHNAHFNSAIKKYGWYDGFSHEIIEDNIVSLELANEREIFWIAYYDSYYNGYNLTKGGDNHDHLGRAVVKINKETLEIVGSFENTREAARNVNGDHTLIQRCCSFKKNNDRQCISAYGFYWCYKDKYDENWIPKIKVESHSSGEEILQIQKIKNSFLIVNSFPSILNAASELQIPHPNIWQCCNNGKYITAGGFYWCYAKNWNSQWKPRENKNETRFKQVERDDGKRYASIVDAAQDSNIKNPETITRCCKGKQETAGGYQWKYINDIN